MVVFRPSRPFFPKADGTDSHNSLTPLSMLTVVENIVCECGFRGERGAAECDHSFGTGFPYHALNRGGEIRNCAYLVCVAGVCRLKRLYALPKQERSGCVKLCSVKSPIHSVLVAAVLFPGLSGHLGIFFNSAEICLLLGQFSLLLSIFILRRTSLSATNQR